MPSQHAEGYRELKERLDQIVDAVSVDDLPLDDALALYEEAVKLGLRASDLIEQDTEEHRLEEERAALGEGVQGEGDAVGSPAPGSAEGE